MTEGYKNYVGWKVDRMIDAINAMVHVSLVAENSLMTVDLVINLI